MKIGYLMQLGEDIQTPPFNGPANHVRQVVTELECLGHQVNVLYRQGGKLWKSSGLSAFQVMEPDHGGESRPPLSERAVRRVQSALKLPYAAYFESRRFSQVCQQELGDCDLLLERLTWMGYGGALAARSLKIPLVLEYNGDPLADLEAKGMAPRGLQLRLSSWLMRKNLSSAAHLVATGNGWRKSLIERWGVEPGRITVVENGTGLVRLLRREDLRSFTPGPDEPGDVTLIYVGGFYPWHGIDRLLLAVAKAASSGLALKVILIGSGQGLDQAKEQAAGLGLGGQVRFMGQMQAQEYAPLLAGADIGVSPYCGWEEFSGLKIFDYKAAGLPTIASGRDGQPDTLTHGRTGWIVPPCDEDALYQAIVQLAAEPELRRKMGQNARQEAEAVHGWDHTARQLERIFYSVTGKLSA